MAKRSACTIALAAGVIAWGIGNTAAWATLPYGAKAADMSAYALGTMTWNIIFIESDGSIDANQEDWSPQQLTSIKNEISQAKDYWEGLTAGFHPNAQLSVTLNYLNAGAPITVGQEPITRSHNDQSLWGQTALAKLGYTHTNIFTNAINLNNDTRNSQGTHWATTLFIVDDTVDPDNKFTSGYFAYSYLGGPFMVLTAGNNGWGESNFNMVLAHEMGHAFFALDEYAAAGTRTTQRSGYLNGVNGNASLNESGQPVTPPQSQALMLNNGNQYTGQPYQPSDFSLVQVGLVDTDGDTVPDILDVPPGLTGSITGSSSATGTLHFTGRLLTTALANLNTQRSGVSNSRSAMTINTIEAAYYVINGGDPVALLPEDEAWGDYDESFAFTLTGLPGGQYTLQIFGYNSVDIRSNLLTYSFISTAPVPEPASAGLLVLGTIGLLWRSRGGCVSFRVTPVCDSKP